MYNENIKCQQCGKDLTDDEMCRISRDKTLRLCDPHWIWAVTEMKKIEKIWSKLEL